MFVLSQSDIRGGIFPIYATLAAAKEQDSWEIAFPFHFSLVWCQNGKHFEIHTSVFSTTSRIYSRSFSNNVARLKLMTFQGAFFFFSVEVRQTFCFVGTVLIWRNNGFLECEWAA